MKKRDFSEWPNQKLWPSRTTDSWKEKVWRAYRAICKYNKVNESKIAVTRASLRKITGVDGRNISNWITVNCREVVEENQRWGIHNHRFPDITLNFYNRRYSQYQLSEM
ncbi:MAG: hypothetical protein F6K55_29080, partial [Moorea sp. SIO4A3]|nr:hypothetical protein [Moorena sp. SIO4A3]